MPHCVCCKARTTEYVVLPKTSSGAIQKWVNAFNLNINELSNGRNVICRSHASSVDIEQSHNSSEEQGTSTGSTTISLNTAEIRLTDILHTMGNVPIKRERTDEFDNESSSPNVDIPEASGSEQKALPATDSPNGALDEEIANERECSVCLQPFSLPIKLPCGHVFCYLCAKGFVSQHARCAFCRADIPQHYMNLPELVRDEPQSSAAYDTKYVWYYEGRNGWWQFEERLGDEIEEALAAGGVEYEIQIAGFMYVIDLRQMIQYRRDRPERTRRIKRDHFLAPKKGIAGLREDLINGTII